MPESRLPRARGPRSHQSSVSAQRIGAAKYVDRKRSWYLPSVPKRSGGDSKRPSKVPAADEDSSADAPPTIIPAFDPQQFATEAEIRDRLPTLIDDEALEQARVASLPSLVPPPRPPLSSFPGPRDSVVEIDETMADISSLTPEQQVALVRASLAPMSRVPFLSKKLSELGDVLGDPKTAYVLGFVDGILPLDTIVEVTGLPELDSLLILEQMIELGVILFR